MVKPWIGGVWVCLYSKCWQGKLSMSECVYHKLIIGDYRYPPFFDEDHLKLYEKILQGKIRWPSYFDPNAKDLLKRLLTSDLSRRYGNLKNGAEDIKCHPWFDGVDFDRVGNRQIRAPYIPHIRGDGDASHFDKYPEQTERYGQPCEDPYRDKFPDF